MEFKHRIGKASEFSSEEIDTFKNIVITAGEVMEATFDGLISKNPVFLFYPNTQEIEAVGALKIPNPTYKKKVFKKSKTELNSDDYIYELGWIVSLIENKGRGQLITRILSEYTPYTYSTVRSGNEVMNHILKKYGFTQTGNSFDSDRGDYQINLYVKSNSIQKDSTE